MEEGLEGFDMWKSQVIREWKTLASEACWNQDETIS